MQLSRPWNILVPCFSAIVASGLLAYGSHARLSNIPSWSLFYWLAIACVAAGFLSLVLSRKIYITSTYRYKRIAQFLGTIGVYGFTAALCYSFDPFWGITHQDETMAFGHSITGLLFFTVTTIFYALTYKKTNPQAQSQPVEEATKVPL